MMGETRGTVILVKETSQDGRVQEMGGKEERRERVGQAKRCVCFERSMNPTQHTKML